MAMCESGALLRVILEIMVPMVLVRIGLFVKEAHHAKQD